MWPIVHCVLLWLGEIKISPHPSGGIDWIHKFHNVAISYPTMLHSEQKCAHFCSEWSIVGIWNRCILGIVKLFIMQWKSTYNRYAIGIAMTWVPFYWYGLTLISAWISNHMPCKICDEITYPFSNFNISRVEVFEWISTFIPHIVLGAITYPYQD